MTALRPFTLLACLATAIAAQLHAAPVEAAPGFLQTYERLAPASGNDSVLAYRKEDFDLKQYDRLLVDVVEIRYAGNSPYKAFSSEEKEHVRQAVGEALKRTVDGRFTLVNEPGLGVLHVRIAITDIDAAKKSKNLLSYTPVGLIKQGVEKAAGVDVALRSATLEAEILDALTGEQLMSTVDAQAAHRKDRPGEASWKNVAENVAVWAQQLVANCHTLDASGQCP